MIFLSDCSVQVYSGSLGLPDVFLLYVRDIMFPVFFKFKPLRPAFPLPSGSSRPSSQSFALQLRRLG